MALYLDYTAGYPQPVSLAGARALTIVEHQGRWYPCAVWTDRECRIGQGTETRAHAEAQALAIAARQNTR